MRVSTKKKYETAYVEVIEFDLCDTVTTSGGNGGNNGNAGVDDDGKDWGEIEWF